MTTLFYPSAISEEVCRTNSVTASFSQGPTQELVLNKSPVNAKTGGFAALISHVARLEAHLLRGEKSKFFEGRFEVTPGSRQLIGNGASFIVDRAELRWTEKSAKNGDIPSSMKFIAIKTVRERPTNTLRWRGILFEIRTLLHEPLRYHPNIVRLLEIGWDATETGSAFPALYLEFAEFGTLDTLQRSQSAPLPFRIKQKLCYDAGRGLSILHACGIVHGDLKHENVLVFRNQYDFPADQPYTAKLVDFGGAVLDTTQTDRYILPMRTVPFEAPETNQSLTAQGIRMTDVYSFGMLVWRCFVDCTDLLVPMGVRQVGGTARLTDAEYQKVMDLKASDEMRALARESVMDYRRCHSLPQEISPMVRSILGSTLQQDPTKRSLDQAQALLRGMPFTAVADYIAVKDLANQRRDLSEENQTPGQHGLNLDSVGYHLGRLGDDYDAQNNLPGYRPRLAQPSNEGFLFEPLKLKNILGWTQQTEMLNELESLARAPNTNSTVELPSFTASFFIFQAHLAAFGTDLKAFRACQWLHLASLPPEEFAKVDYLAKAWLSRVCAAMGVPDPRSEHDQIEDLFWSIIRGHRNCVDDAYKVISTLRSEKDKAEARRKICDAMWLFRTMTGGVGMPHYASRKLQRPYDLQDLDKLDKEIQLELGDEYDTSLRRQRSDQHEVAHFNEARSDVGFRFDKIYVNHKGHGLLHMASSLGELGALTHIYKKYNCNIDLSNQSIDESPLVCACRSGHYYCAKFLIDNGAKVDGTENGQEAPLHWLSSFTKDEMILISRLLLQNGANHERSTGIMRKDVRDIIQDWEDNFAIPVTPLGRAVLLQNLDAVRVLLSVADVDPVHTRAEEKSKIVSAVELASVLTLPEILEVLLDKVEEKRARDPTYNPHISDEIEMLEAAHDMRHTRSYDPLSLQSRVIRCGVNYKIWLARTMRCLHARRKRHPSLLMRSDRTVAAKALCREVSLGNIDIVETLLELGHDPNGAGDYQPLNAAVLANADEIFDLLTRRGAALSSEMAGNLLILLASRPRSSPSGIAVAQRLIAAGADIEPKAPTAPSAFVMAVKNRYFDLANLFVNYGAGVSVNQCYHWSADDQPVTLLGHLLQRHTYASLQSINFLVQKHKDGGSAVRLQPCISDISGLTALHAIAASNPKLWNNHSQISAQILRNLLDTFPNTDSLGMHAVHPTYGTPLTEAILSMNEPVISALLDSEHQNSLLATVPMPLPHSPDCEEALVNICPVQLVYNKALEAAADLEAHNHLTAQDIRERLSPFYTILQSLQTAYSALRLHPVSTSSLVTKDQSSAASHAVVPPHNSQMPELGPTASNTFEVSFVDLSSRLVELDRRLTLECQTNRLSLDDVANSDIARHPVIEDLSVLTEEKPTNWVQGQDMNWEVATRTLLKSMRTGNIGNPIDKFMDQKYNKRAENLRPMAPNTT